MRCAWQTGGNGFGIWLRKSGAGFSGDLQVSKRNGNGKGQSRAHMLAIRPRAPALRHGGTVRLSEEEIAGACGEIRRIAPWLDQPRYGIALEQLARLLARVRVMDEIIARHPKGWVFRATGSGRIEVNTGERYYLSLAEQVRRLLTDLGLTPSAARALGLNVESPDAKDLSALLAEAASDGEDNGGGG